MLKNNCEPQCNIVTFHEGLYCTQLSHSLLNLLRCNFQKEEKSDARFCRVFRNSSVNTGLLKHVI